MDFGDILSQWDNLQSEKANGRRSADARSEIPQNGQAWRNKKKQPDSMPSAGKKQSGQIGKARIHREPRINPMEFWLRRYGIEDKDAAMENAEEKNRLNSRALLHSMPYDDTIDLHGLTGDEAWKKLDSFIAACCRRGFCKVLIIHGKGNHSNDTPVLRGMVRTFIEQDSRLGEFGFADNADGGKGATWVIIRKKDL
ncbi:MAG: Smr/MutS family protein [Bacteroides sp.]|nr:Smr/MutS family protein [Prevotella sp.]MCM1408530.1 Smr/MutS family protein [Treponema brennaborense]MCM1470756.1 Smr/MutS family protein [Bacteroides sp.]